MLEIFFLDEPVGSDNRIQFFSDSVHGFWVAKKLG
jgi:hypothetical protein